MGDSTDRSSDTFQPLQDRWSSNAFPALHEDTFPDHLASIIEDTLKHNNDFNAETRGKVLQTIFEFSESGNLRPYRGRITSELRSIQKQIFILISDVLKVGFDNQQITTNLIKYLTDYSYPSENYEKFEDIYRLQLLERFIAAGIEINSSYQDSLDDFVGEDPLFDAMIAAGANPSLLVDGRIRSGLLSEKALLKIIECGVDINVVDKNGSNPYFFLYNTDAIKILQKSGCDINHVNHAGETPLSNKDSGGFDTLVESGASMFSPPNPHPIWMCNISPSELMNILANSEALKALHQLDPQTGNSALHYWASSEDNEAGRICNKLIKLGFDLEARNNQDKTPIMCAAEHHRIKTWKVLAKKSNLDAVSNNGYSACEWAIANDMLPPPKFLQLMLKSKIPLNNKVAGTELSLLGLLIARENFSHALEVISSGAVIDDSAVQTIIKHNSGDEFQSLLKVTEFVTHTQIDFEVSVETSYKSKILANLQDSNLQQKEPANGLEFLDNKFWPPVPQKRNPIVIEKIPEFKTADKVCFKDDEYDDYLSSTRNEYTKPYSRQEGSIGNDAKVRDKVMSLKGSKSFPFTSFIKASDETVFELWNEVISKKPKVLHTNDGFGNNVSISVVELRYLLARYDTPVLPGLLRIAKTKLEMMVKILVPVSSSHIAPLMAKALIGTPVSRWARSWFLRHQDIAIHGLIPAAVGISSNERKNCENALRFMAQNGMSDQIASLATNYGCDVERSIDEILNQNRCLDYFTKELPELPPTFYASSKDNPVVTQTGAPLTEQELASLVGMMSLSTYDDVYPALKEVLPNLESESVARFAWTIYEKWEKYSWEFSYSDDYDCNDDGFLKGRSETEIAKLRKAAKAMFYCLAYMGDDTTVKMLTPHIEYHYPADAKIALDILANIGTEFAIRSINNLVLKTKYKPILEYAPQLMETIAEVRDLTKHQLEDRLVPTFGLDNLDEKILSFGNSKFNIQFNEKLTPTLLDCDDKTIKDLPKPTKSDDKNMVKEAVSRWKKLKSDSKNDTKVQLYRLEQAMLSQRSWTVSEFNYLLLNHPFLEILVRHLVWAEIKDQATIRLFRVSSESQFKDLKGDIVVLHKTSQVNITHPIHMGESIDAWRELFLSEKLKQPFSQVARQCYSRKDDNNKDFFGVDGGKVPTKSLRSLKSKGWTPSVGGAGLIEGFEKTLSTGIVYIYLDGIMFIDRADNESDEQTIKVAIPSGTEGIEYSELVREIKALLH